MIPLLAVPLFASTLLSAPEQVRLGDIFVIHSSTASAAPAEVEFMQKRYPVIQPKGWTASFYLCAVDLEAAPGTYPVKALFHGTRPDETVLSIDVRERTFPVEELTVPPKMVTPPPEVHDRIARERAAAAAVYRNSDDQALWEPPFVRPSKGSPSGNFGRRRILNGLPKSPHSGEDYSAPRGEAVRTTARGRVSMARDLYYSGLTVLLDHGGGLVSQYFHLDEIAVSEGQQVDSGEIIGRVGSTGRVTGPHLHFGIRLRENRVDPSMLWDLFPE